MRDLNRLIQWLNASTLQTTNNPLYQVIKALIEATRQLQDEIAATIAEVEDSIPGDISEATFLTTGAEVGDLPNSRQLIAGTNITFDDSVANERTINASGGGSGDDYVVLSDGANPPNPMDDGTGNFIYVTYTP